MSLRRAAAVVCFAILLAVSSSACRAVSVAGEIKIGEDASKQVVKEMPLSKNQKYQDGITALGKKLTPFVKRTQIPYHFAVVTDSKNTINAFALPGGYVYFTEHMWMILTPDERAAVLAHEITHCDLRHGIDESIKQQQRFLWTLPLIVLGGPAGADAWMMGNWIVNARYSRKMERQADEQAEQDRALDHAFDPCAHVAEVAVANLVARSADEASDGGTFLAFPAEFGPEAILEAALIFAADQLVGDGRSMFRKTLLQARAGFGRGRGRCVALMLPEPLGQRQ